MQMRLLLPWMAAAMVLAACSTVPLTGRKQIRLVPEATMIAQSAASYRQVVSEGPLSADVRQAEQVRRVGRRMAAAVERYFRERGEAEVLAGFAWEFNLIEKDEPNAWCMPGGKVAVYTGILPYTLDETGLAVVMGHEIAHAVARHGSERVSHQLIQQAGAYGLAFAVKDADYRAAFMAVYGIGTQVGGILPYSREHESEADRMGLVFMAMAGYDPQAAIGFWQRMAQAGTGAPPELLSTHPSDATRIRRLREALPEAMAYYRP